MVAWSYYEIDSLTRIKKNEKKHLTGKKRKQSQLVDNKLFQGVAVDPWVNDTDLLPGAGTFDKSRKIFVRR